MHRCGALIRIRHSKGPHSASAEVSAASDALFVDYDNDGLHDLVAATPSGLRVLRNTGGSWTDVTATAAPKEAATRLFGAGDLDLGAADILGAVEHLALEVRQLHHIGVDEHQPSGVGGAQGQRQRRAQAAQPDEEEGATQSTRPG